MLYQVFDLLYALWNPYYQDFPKSDSGRAGPFVRAVSRNRVPLLVLQPSRLHNRDGAYRVQHLTALENRCQSTWIAITP